MQSTPDRAKIRSLHGLRGLMAWWVVVGHMSLAFDWKLPFVDHNKLAVDVFILLSGFVIAMLIDRKREPYPEYLTRRAFRLFPLYLLVLAVSALLLPVQLGAWHMVPPNAANANRIELAQMALDNLGRHLLVHIPLLQGVFPYGFGSQTAYTIVGQAWSISLEWQFYLVAPLLVWSLSRTRRWPVAMLALVPLLLVAPRFTDAFLGSKILHFYIGMASYLWLNRQPSQAWLGLAALCGAGALWLEGASQAIPLGIWAAVLWSSVQPAHSMGHSPARLLGARPLFYLGEISYSTYLLHMIPLYGSIWLLGRAGLSGATLAAASGVTTIVVTFVGSVLSYRYVEKQGIALGARIRLPQFRKPGPQAAE